MPKMIRSQFGSTSHCVWRMNGTSCRNMPATTAPHSVKIPPISAVAIRVSESCVGKPYTRRVANLGREQASGHARHERGERERPHLVERDVHSGGERRRLALADRRPRAARLGHEVDEREQEQERADDHRVSVVGGVAVPHEGRCTGTRLAEVDLPLVAGESWTAIREVERREDDSDRARAHERDQRQVEAAEPQGGQPDQHADHTGDRRR